MLGQRHSRRYNGSGCSGQIDGMYRWWGGHRIITGIRDHGNHVGSWGKYERFREHPLTWFRRYGGHRVYAPISTALCDGAPPASLGRNRCLTLGPEYLPNTTPWSVRVTWTSMFGCVTVEPSAGVTKVTNGGRDGLGDVDGGGADGVAGGGAGGGLARWTVTVVCAEATRSRWS
jgi:hypothetical protein